MLSLGWETAAEEKPSLMSEAYQALKQALRNNTLPLGFQGSEQEIATRLGMSRTPVHEAVLRLQEEGLLRILPKRGVVVCALSPHDMKEIYDVTIALEAVAAELLAGMPPERRGALANELDELNKTMRRALRANDLDQWAKADGEFHRALVERCDNKRIAKMAQTIRDQYHRARMLTLRMRARPTKSLSDHQEIIDAIRLGKVADAHDAARRHRIRARDELMPLLMQHGITQL
jgi:DNA-binding GntR family transcriptional regulator